MAQSARGSASPSAPVPLAGQAWLRGARRAEFAVGLASRAQPRESNPCALAWHGGDDVQRLTHGAVALLADGWSREGNVGSAGGLAARLACESFVEGYYSLSPTLGVAMAADRALSSYNRWLHAIARADPGLAGAGSTFTAFVLKGRLAHVLHLGDSRAWHWRGGRLRQLSVDHLAVGSPDMPRLARALGLELELRIDHDVFPMEPHDRLLLTSAGVHDVVSVRALEEVLTRHDLPDRTAEAIVELAMAAGSTSNASALVIDCMVLPAPDQDGLAALAAGLPVPPAPALGEVIDGLLLERQLYEGEQTVVFAARSQSSGEGLVAKFPRPERTGEQAARAAFVRERLIAARVDSAHVAQIIALAPDAQSRVYTLMPFYEGETLEALLRRGRPSCSEGLRIAAGLARGVVALHRLGVIHRDIKPENVLVEPGGGVRLLDFGVARIPGMDDAQDVPGSHGYLAPELYRGERGDEASDQFAFGVTLYRIFTGRFPFTDLQALQRPGRDGPANPAALRPDLPAWLALVLRRSVQVRAQDRFGDMVELGLALEQGCALPDPRPPALPLFARKPVLVWQLLSAALAFALIVVLLLR